MTSAGFGVYVHWPFCASKCPYCDFNSHVRAGGIDEARFLAAFLRELSTGGAGTGPRGDQHFFGGGTPSLMEPATVGAILDAIAGTGRWTPDAEVTLEANPSSVEAGRFRGYRAAGINRVSLGVQSLDDRSCASSAACTTSRRPARRSSVARGTFDAFLLRSDLCSTGPDAGGMARRTGPALTSRGRASVALPAHHRAGDAVLRARMRAASCRFPMGRGGRPLRVTQEMTERAGLPAYEISNHAAPGEEMPAQPRSIGATANMPASGLAPMAASSSTGCAGLRRRSAVPSVGGAGGGRGTASSKMTPLSRAEEADEALLMGLRLTEGIDLEPARGAGRAWVPERRTIDEARRCTAHRAARRRSRCAPRHAAASCSTRWCSAWRGASETAARSGGRATD